MNKLKTAVFEFLDNITQDINNVHDKIWLKTAVISHCYNVLRKQDLTVTREAIEAEVNAWWTLV